MLRNATTVTLFRTVQENQSAYIESEASKETKSTSVATKDVDTVSSLSLSLSLGFRFITKANQIQVELAAAC